MSPDRRPPPAPDGQGEAAVPASAEEVAAVLAAVQAWAEDEAAAAGSVGAAEPPAWAAAGRGGHPAQTGTERPGGPRRGRSG